MTRISLVLAGETKEAVARLGEAVLSLRPLVDVLEYPVRVAVDAAVLTSPGRSSGLLGAADLLDRVAERLGAPRFELCPAASAGEFGVFAQVVSDRLGLAGNAEPVLSVTRDSLFEVDQIVDEVVRTSFEGYCICTEVRSFDGVPLRAYAAGERKDKAVILVSACGMPAKLCEPWIRFLAKEHFVLTWESRGLFGNVTRLDNIACDVTAQVADLFAVMDHFGVRCGHLMGLCGGAVIVLAAAAQKPERAASLSLWHGDFELGPDGPKTKHQHNLKTLLSLAAVGRVSSRDLHRLICDSMLTSTPPALAHLVLYPYATAELLLRYCKLNVNIMSLHVGLFLDSIVQPTLVVTSQDDKTSHPDGSRKVAAAIPEARLHVAPHGDHLSLFTGGDDLMQLAGQFISLQESQTGFPIRR